MRVKLPFGISNADKICFWPRSSILQFCKINLSFENHNCLSSATPTIHSEKTSTIRPVALTSTITILVQAYTAFISKATAHKPSTCFPNESQDANISLNSLRHGTQAARKQFLGILRILPQSSKMSVCSTFRTHRTVGCNNFTILGEFAYYPITSLFLTVSDPKYQEEFCLPLLSLSILYCTFPGRFYFIRSFPLLLITFSISSSSSLAILLFIFVLFFFLFSPFFFFPFKARTPQL